MTIEEIEKRSKEFDKKALRQLNELIFDLYKYIDFKQHQRRTTFCYKCYRFSHQRKEDGSFLQEIHEKMAFCSHNVTVGGIFRLVIGNVILKNNAEKHLDNSLIEILKRFMKELTDYINNLENCE